MRTDCQRKTSLVVWSGQPVLVSGIDFFGSSFLIKTDRFFFLPSRTDESGNVSHNH